MSFPARATVAAVALPLSLALGLSTPVSAQGGVPEPDTAAATERTVPPAPRAARAAADSVLVVSVDGLNPAAIRTLGRRGAPTLHRLERKGASTFNARTSYESTSTLPNHIGMVTGRRVRAAGGGHGVTWNDDRLRPRTVQKAAGREVDSAFSVVREAGGRTALFASKQKFSLFGRSWGRAVSRSVIDEDNTRLVRKLVRDLRTQDRALRFVHLSWPDSAGHRHGYMSAGYVQAVAKVDRLLAEVIRTVERQRRSGRTVVLLTSDHGGGERAKHHDKPGSRINYRIPFFAYGPGVQAGADLYELNPAYADPGHGRPHYDAPAQPVRNLAVGNLALDLLGLPAIPGSTVNAAQDLKLRP